jgi:hypothetical protein
MDVGAGSMAPSTAAPSEAAAAVTGDMPGSQERRRRGLGQSTSLLKSLAGYVAPALHRPAMRRSKPGVPSRRG